MPLLLETVKIEEGRVSNLAYHQKRFDKSRKVLFPDAKPLNLSSCISPPVNHTGLIRCRIVYDETIRSVEYLPYKAKVIRTLKIVHSDICYAHKYADREAFASLLHSYADYDEIIIEKSGLITDTTISNLAFYDGTKWWTPAKPLLEGTMRAKLLEEGFLHKKAISREEIPQFKKVALINAMLGFKIINPRITS